MKALKDFQYSLDGNTVTTFKEGEEVPEIAQPYAKKNGIIQYDVPQQKKAQAPANKAKRAPENKAK